MAQQGGALRHLMQSLHRQNIPIGGLRECRTSLRTFSAQAAGPSGEQQSMPTGEDTPPPSAASTVGLMAVGALGAIGIAAVGVYGVLQISLMVAQGTGRSIMADKEKVEAEQRARSQPPE